MHSERAFPEKQLVLKMKAICSTVQTVHHYKKCYVVNKKEVKKMYSQCVLKRRTFMREDRHITNGAQRGTNVRQNTGDGKRTAAVFKNLKLH